MTIEKLDISMSKKFIYFPNEGWSWHKIWNIPSIHIDLQVIFFFKYEILKTSEDEAGF